MKSAAAIIALAATAQAVDNQVGPFKLTIVDAGNSSLNGLHLWSCHAGAGIEALCYGSQGNRGDDYFFNTTGTAAEGKLIYNAPFGSNPPNMNYTPSVTSFQLGPSSGLAAAMIYPGDGSMTQLGFDEAGKLYVASYWDEASFKPNERPEPKITKLYQWEACWNIVGTYYYPVLNWALSAGAPRNPTCSAVNVTRSS
jgi:hypothetical protein